MNFTQLTPPCDARGCKTPSVHYVDVGSGLEHVPFRLHLCVKHYDNAQSGELVSVGSAHVIEPSAVARRLGVGSYATETSGTHPAREPRLCDCAGCMEQEPCSYRVDPERHRIGACQEYADRLGGCGCG